jgi:hypothetical protein
MRLSYTGRHSMNKSVFATEAWMSTSLSVWLSKNITLALIRYSKGLMNTLWLVVKNWVGLGLNIKKNKTNGEACHILKYSHQTLPNAPGFDDFGVELAEIEGGDMGILQNWESFPSATKSEPIDITYNIPQI